MHNDHDYVPILAAVIMPGLFIGEGNHNHPFSPFSNYSCGNPHNFCNVKLLVNRVEISVMI